MEFVYIFIAYCSRFAKVFLLYVYFALLALAIGMHRGGKAGTAESKASEILLRV